MALKHTGGPAFPNPKDVQTRGMDLRDWFAAQALHSLIEGWPAASLHEPPSWSDSEMGLLAHQAYQFADAMLAERKIRAQADPQEDVAAGAQIKFTAKPENQSIGAMRTEDTSDAGS